MASIKALNQLFSRCRFYVFRQWKMQPLALAMAGVSALVMTTAIVFHARVLEEENIAAREWRLLAGREPLHRRSESDKSTPQPGLPSFRSTHLVEALDLAARETRLTPGGVHGIERLSRDPPLSGSSAGRGCRHVDRRHFLQPCRHWHDRRARQRQRGGQTVI